MSDATATHRKATKVGVVTSSAADKSVVVKVENFVMHPLYHRFVRTSSKLMAHDEENTCNAGDRVLIEECRPVSRRKRWRVRRILERAE
ncbi:MAG TPA: 30S ribosomal protein S17 [Thermoanaerobaculales bacterium]|nr:30S ribosomal protein S17 [Thermoanaerobaculales bacterium]HPA80743.1 30S ribosomal protein S17 [Thermoanaerobaculales bacterium]HQP44806.1 30S ribosomal protein S17 [Thermoanaerobaculales bacterium]